MSADIVANDLINSMDLGYLIWMENEELTKLKNEYEAALSRFNNALNPSAIDAAIYEMTAAEVKLRSLILRMKQN